RDTHLGNIVAAEREPWLLIDPKPCLGEAAFDAGFLIIIQVQTTPTPAHARAVVVTTARHLDVPIDRAGAWAFLRAIEARGGEVVGRRRRGGTVVVRRRDRGQSRIVASMGTRTPRSFATSAARE
ncbi:aminoglycoside phosphotransferase family protein, partial [Micrococcus luteus]|uniref:aminoglycoside phosphotransferase family protein n=1 Tax=Micrococcus luteus TaxID=1270 RepID=UPI00365194CA